MLWELLWSAALTSTKRLFQSSGDRHWNDAVRHPHVSPARYMEALTELPLPSGISVDVAGCTCGRGRDDREILIDDAVYWVGEIAA